MEIKQETKSLPRNRKCGNCRYFEPAPLWRKGWCRNPRLYDRRANHLVDAATIDCEQVFRARIYWEPVPISEISETSSNSGPGYSPFVGGPAAADSGQTDATGRGRTAPVDGVLRPRAVTNNTQLQLNENGNLPVITRRERATAAPGIVAKPSKVRRWLVENIPYYDKIDGPISRINLLKVLPWVVVIMLLLVVLLNVFGSKKVTTSTDPSQTDQNTTPSLALGNTTPTEATNQSSLLNGKPNSSPTPTLSNLVPTATVAPQPTPTAKVVDATAKVVNVGPKGLNMRKDAGKSSELIKQIPEGETVTIRSADFRKVDGIVWWPISYKGVDGWVAADYLEKKS